MIVDSHAHLDMPAFDQDLPDVIRRAEDAGVDLIVTIGTGTPEGDSIGKTLDIAGRHECIRAGIGVSPHDARLCDAAYLERLEQSADHPKVVLWGEIGLDYHYDLSPRDVQRDVFRRQVRIARGRNLPVAIHCRDAWTDLIWILRTEYPDAGGKIILHSFTGTREQALEGVALGYAVSFSGIVTFRNAGALREAAAAVPLDYILVETDSPYLAPLPHRGKRNEPAFAADTARALARLKGIEFAEFARATSANARRILQLVGSLPGTMKK
jgi:TatD DNase family protein